MLKDIVKTVAPFLGGMLGGPLGAAAVKVLGEVLLNNSGADESDIEVALGAALPQQLAELKRIDTEYKTKMAELGIDEKKISAMDRDSARNREIALQDRMPAVLAMGMTLGFFGVLMLLIFYPVQSNVQNVLDVMLGALGTAWISCVTYYFGSSHGSLVKTNLMLKE